MSKILDGKKLAGEISEKLKNKITELKEKNIVPKLIIFQVGDNPASNIYVRMKQKKAEEIGAVCQVQKLPENTSQDNLCKLIEELNFMDTVHGIIVQLPLPDGFDKNRIINKISSEKDVDGLTDVNQIKILNGENDGLFPATPKGVIALLDNYGIEIQGRRVVVVGRSRLVGKSLALMLLNRDATVTICHSKSQDLQAITKEADILISAVGQSGLIKVDFVKPGAIVVDVGISNTADEKNVGDVDFEQVKEVAGYITPMPGGVGPMTVVSLFENLVKATEGKLLN